MKRILPIILISIVFCSCKNIREKIRPQSPQPTDTIFVKADTLFNQLTDSAFLTIQHTDFTEIMQPKAVDNLSKHIYLVDTSDITTPANGFKLYLPLQRIFIIGSNQLISFFINDEQSNAERLCGIVTAENDKPTDDRQTLPFVNTLENISAKDIISIEPELILLSQDYQPYTAELLLEIGIPTIVVPDTEQMPIAQQIEWHKLIGLLLNETILQNDTTQRNN